MRDAVDDFLAAWARERPDLDASPMGVVGRLHRLAPLWDARLRTVFAEEGLGGGEFDVLATLRRAGAPYSLSPAQLVDTMLITGGAVTKRVDRLVRRGLVRRTVAEGDARGRQVALTPAGLRLVDRLAERHFANEERLLAPLDATERAQLADLLRRLLGEVEGAE